MATTPSSDPTVILSYARTPMGAMQGALADALGALLANRIVGHLIFGALELGISGWNEREPSNPEQDFTALKARTGSQPNPTLS